MSAYHAQFMIPEKMSISSVKSALQKSLRLSDESTTKVNRIYYDTFDWRIYGKQKALEGQPSNGGSTFYLSELKSGEICTTQRLDFSPKFAWDLPPTTLRKFLKPIIEMRALLPQARVISRLQRLRILDKRQKTVAWIDIEDNSVMDPEGTAKELSRLLKLVPVKGYDKVAARLLKLINSELELVPAKENLLHMALNTVELKPGSYTSKLNLNLDPEMRADEATKIVLKRLLDTMQDNEDGTRKDIDSEFLHDFRVAIRRTRSALSQIKGVLPAKILTRFQPEFAWLGQLTGPTRDLDVYLLKFDGYRDSLPTSVQADLDPLHEFLQKHQLIEQQTLNKALSSSRYKTLIKAWRSFLDTPLPKQPTPPNANRPINLVARERTWRLYRRALKEGRAIKPETPAEALHELRKTCKKLRYLMEFFQSLYPPSEIKALIKVLKILQDNLGDFQDYEVQVSTLKQFSQQMLEEGQTPATTIMAMGVLVESLAERQHQTRQAFAARFDEFALQENQAHFKGLFYHQTPNALAS